MMNNDLMFSSNKDDWETPQWLFDELNKEFDFTLDAAATVKNKKCDNYLIDGLIQLYHGRVFCNPPYSRGLQKKFIKHAHDQFIGENPELVVMLLPARTDTIAFHEYIYGKAEIRFLKGRLKFEVNGVPAKDPAPFPSMVVIYR
jgi:site-specific DNA-methyltransferase (adenine-specific)